MVFLISTQKGIIRRILLVLMTISIFSCKSSKLQFEHDLSGNWEFRKMLLNNQIIDVAELNECKHRDVLKIDSVFEFHNYEINEELEGYLIGSSNHRVCSVNVETFEYEVHGNSCYTSWVLQKGNNQRLIRVSEGSIVIYNLKFLNANEIVLTQAKSTGYYKEHVAEKIWLRKKIYISMNWKELLQSINELVLNNSDIREEYKNPPNQWLGFEPATDDEIQALEEQLETTLPPSFKDFLKVSNGFRQISPFIWDVYSTQKIDWLINLDEEFVILWQTSFASEEISDEEYFVYSEEQRTEWFRTEYLSDCLAISGWGDSAILLLNPNVKFGEEWEAWMFANWHPGAVRYKSFKALIMQEYEGYLYILEHEAD